jgi:hypothetical protein
MRHPEDGFMPQYSSVLVLAYIREVETYNARATAVEVNEWRNASAQIFFSDNRLGPALYWLSNGDLFTPSGMKSTIMAQAFGRYRSNNLESLPGLRNA